MAHTASLSQLQTPPWALVNGELVRYEDVRIHISAEALTRALSVFEGLKGYWNTAGNIFAVRTPRQHYDRLCRSAALFHIPIRFAYDDFVAGLAKLSGQLLVPDRDLWFRTTLYVTTGHWGEGTVADLIVTAFTQPKHNPHPMRLGVSTWRRAVDVALPARVKCSANYVGGRLARIEVRRLGYD
ncbi:MAG: aminotransferase class IV, partial [Pseudonocardiaceae bacterium]